MSGKGDSVCVTQPNMKYKNWITNKRKFEESNGFETVSANILLPSDWGGSP